MHIRNITRTRPAIAQAGTGPLNFILNLLQLQQAIDTVIALGRSLKGR